MLPYLGCFWEAVHSCFDDEEVHSFGLLSPMVPVLIKKLYHSLSILSNIMSIKVRRFVLSLEPILKPAERSNVTIIILIGVRA